MPAQRRHEVWIGRQRTSNAIGVDREPGLAKPQASPLSAFWLPAPARQRREELGSSWTVMSDVDFRPVFESVIRLRSSRCLRSPIGLASGWDGAEPAHDVSARLEEDERDSAGIFLSRRTSWKRGQQGLPQRPRWRLCRFRRREGRCGERRNQARAGCRRRSSEAESPNGSGLARSR